MKQPQALILFVFFACISLASCNTSTPEDELQNNAAESFPEDELQNSTADSFPGDDLQNDTTDSFPEDDLQNDTADSFPDAELEVTTAEPFDFPPSQIREVTLEMVHKKVDPAELTLYLYSETAAGGDGPVGWATMSAVRGPEGILYFATDLGVSRFDGERWHHDDLFNGRNASALTIAADGSVVVSGMGGFYRREGEKWIQDWTGLSDLHPYCCWFWPIAVGPENDLWLGDLMYDGEGVHHFDGTTWEFYQSNRMAEYKAISDDGDVSSTETKGSFLPDNVALFIAVDPIGAAWIETVGGLVRYDGQNWTIIEGEEYFSGEVLSVGSAPNGSLWFRTDQGLSHFDGQLWTRYTIAGSEVDTFTILPFLTFNPDGDLWFAGEIGPIHFDGETATEYELNLDVYREPAWVFDTPIVVDAEGALWLAGSYAGIYRFRPASD